MATQEQIDSTIKDSRMKYEDKVNNLAQKAQTLTNELKYLKIIMHQKKKKNQLKIE